MSIRKIGLSTAMVTFALLATMSAASAGGSRHGGWDHDHHRPGYKQCFHRHDGVRCFWRWRY